MSFFKLLLVPLLIYVPLYFIVGILGDHYNSHCSDSALESLVANLIPNIIAFLVITLFVIAVRWVAGKLGDKNFTIDKISLKFHFLILMGLFFLASLMGAGVKFIPVLIIPSLCY